MYSLMVLLSGSSAHLIFSKALLNKMCCTFAPKGKKLGVALNVQFGINEHNMCVCVRACMHACVHVCLNKNN